MEADEAPRGSSRAGAGPVLMGASRRLLGPAGPLSKAFPGYEEREGQLAMADAVERALAHDRTLLCEAGTGTGKTLAYLVPAILSGKKVVVSTATKALQEQIITKDIPLIAEHLGLDPQAALGKGLGNYLCLRRYDELRKSANALADANVRRSLPLLEAWAEDTETGDMAELVSLPEGDPIWREVCSSSETRVGQNCAFYDRCFVTRMKRDLEEARLIIVNHHLFFADLSVKMAAEGRGFGGAGALPPYDAVIFDEAHELESVATDFFGVRLSRARLESLLRDADRAFVAAGLADPVRAKGEGTALTAIVQEAAEAFFDALAKLVTANGEVGRPEGRITLGPEAWTGEVADAYHTFDEVLEALANYAQAMGKDEGVRMIAQRATQLRADAARIVDITQNQVTWLEVRPRSISVGASPIHVGSLFRERVIEPIGAVVLTSATLTTSAASASGGSPFRFLRSRMGLVETTTVPIDELEVPSPFDYKSAALLYTPRDLPEVNDPAFVERAADRIAELVAITGGGAFVLCTSVRAMHAFAAALRGRTPRPALVQGDAPKLMLVRRFRASGDGVLIATMSFWEGVDVPGDALRLVVIDKLPFAVPTDPVVAARCRAIEESGGNPFVSYSVPEAAITLKQGFGRLIRARSDRGIVAILDRRIRTRGYGTTMMSVLPPARRTDRLEDVATFWAAAQKR
ncbi:DinG family ATP-dependent helicase YoaA [Minicystis rosea]|nr:DinG family ATP-dependent helicase YoaA [Minicystis rosea]